MLRVHQRGFEAFADFRFTRLDGLTDNRIFGIKWVNCARVLMATWSRALGWNDQNAGYGFRLVPLLTGVKKLIVIDKR